MANENDLERLDAGELDLSGCDFSGADLSNRQLLGRDFSNANLREVKAVRTDFSRCNFQSANLHQLTADEADFSGATLSGILMMNGSFVNAVLQNTILSSSQLQNCNFSGADLTGANFRSCQLVGSTDFENVKFDAATSFEGATGSRSVSKRLVFEGYSYEGGRFRTKDRDASTAEEPATAGFDANAFASGALNTTPLNSIAKSAAELGLRSAIERREADVALELLPQARGRSGMLRGGGVGTDGKVWIEGSVAEIAARMSAEPVLFEKLATDAAQSIAQQLAKFAEKIPNEPDAHAGYEEIRNTLVTLKEGFEEVAAELRRVSLSENSLVRATHVQKAATAARAMGDGFVDWMVEKGPLAGQIIAHLGLATVITGAITYVAGVNPTTTFLVTNAALAGKDIWEVVKLFASAKN